MLSGVDVSAAASRGWRWGELAAMEYNGDVDGCAVDLGFVHVCNGCFGVGLVVEEDVCGSAVCTNYRC